MVIFRIVTSAVLLHMIAIACHGELLDYNFYKLQEDAKAALEVTKYTIRDICDRAISWADRTGNISQTVEVFGNNTLRKLIDQRCYIGKYFDVAKNKTREIITCIQQALNNAVLKKKHKEELEDYIAEIEELGLKYDQAIEDAESILDENQKYFQSKLMEVYETFRTMSTRRMRENADRACRTNYKTFERDSLRKMFDWIQDSLQPLFNIHVITDQEILGVLNSLSWKVEQIQRCLKYRNYELSCKFVNDYEEHFQILHSKMNELLIYNGQQKLRLQHMRSRIIQNFPDSEMIPRLQKSAPYSDGGGSCRNQRAPRIADIQRQQTMDMERMGSAEASTSISSTTRPTNTFSSSTITSARTANFKTSPTSYGSDSSTNSNNSTIRDSNSSSPTMEANELPSEGKNDVETQVTIPRRFEQLQLKTAADCSPSLSDTSSTICKISKEPEDLADDHRPRPDQYQVDADADVDDNEEPKASTAEFKHQTGCVRKDIPIRGSDEVVTTAQKGSQTDLPIPRASHPPRVMIPKIQSLESRPIYPNVPYSPYGSPFGSPRSNRRRTPLRESRRVSIEQSGSFLQLNQYKLMDQIGQGSYGLVKLAYSEEDSTHYAMKILSKRRLLRKAGLMGRGPKKTTSPLDRVYREIAVLKKLDHPNVVKLVEVLDDPLEDSLYLVFELVKQGEVLSIPTEQPLSEERVWCIFRDALQGLEYLHYQRIIHGDIKPGNLLLGEFGRVKIADLGVCNEFLGEDAAMNNGSTAGTPAFRAPETLILGQHLYSGKAADIWALGATLYALTYGNVPFVANSVPAVYEKIKNDQLKLPEQPTISPELRDLLEKILTKDPSRRITLPQIKEHQWVTASGACCLPSEEENCRLVQISDEDIHTVVKSIPKLDTLILIKTMLKNHSFQNPFSKAISGRAPQRGGSRLERFTRAGRSNSAPGAYHMSERQLSSDSILPAVSEAVASSCNESSDQSLDG